MRKAYRGPDNADFTYASVGQKVLLQPQLSPSGSLQNECRVKELLHWLHFSDLEAASMFYTV